MDACKHHLAVEHINAEMPWRLMNARPPQAREHAERERKSSRKDSFLFDLGE